MDSLFQEEVRLIYELNTDSMERIYRVFSSKSKGGIEKQDTDKKAKKGSTAAFTYQDAICLLKDAKVKLPDDKVKMVF